MIRREFMLKWTKDNVNWKTALSSDEYHFNPDGSNGLKCCWRLRMEMDISWSTRLKDGFVIFWSAFTDSENMSHLVIIIMNTTMSSNLVVKLLAYEKLSSVWFGLSLYGHLVHTSG
ncbi:hypothetical protein CEXT_52611 [Caerostris extrusa]|uniref:Uncharacterized protein n=1 Tax=Caerostris extrusa TaxID=172846 RepID=A0AAV4NEX0_CAEEX|nr:hypothetical protein CEXT_52611 [Caerostris extrusa]